MLLPLAPTNELTLVGDNKEDNDFDNTVGVLQEILLDKKFE